MAYDTACVVGGAGAVGSLFCELLLKEYSHVVALDLNCDGSSQLDGIDYVKGDISDANSYVFLQQAELILLALPGDPAIESIPSLNKLLKTGQCLIDTTSVKSNIVARMLELHPKFEVLSINPMFGPSLGFLNQSVACVEINKGPISERLMSLMRNEGATVVVMNAEQHDKCTAVTQVVTHAVILSFGLALGKINYNPDLAKPIWTPPFKTLLALLSRILCADSEVYRDIQSSNPFAQEARKSLSIGLKELSDNILSGKPEEFTELFEGLKIHTDSNCDELIEFCHKIFK